MSDDHPARTNRAARAVVRILVMATLVVVATPRFARANAGTTDDESVAEPAPHCRVWFDPDAQPHFTPFARGTLRITLAMGLLSTTADNYLLIGGGLGFYVVDGLELGFDYQAWASGSPSVQQFGPEIRYVLHFVETLKPYFGAFYRHSFVADHPDVDGIGFRAGLYYAPETARAYFGGGFVYERLIDCANDAQFQCDYAYPEASFGVSF
jgi:hypothetical protein